MKNYRTLRPDQLLKWVENNTEIMRLRTDRDLLPGGYMAAFAPMLVAWNQSLCPGPGGFLLLRNVNYGGNPFERTTVLQSVRVPLDGLESAELTLVPLAGLGDFDLVHHVQLRFIFSSQNSPLLLNLAGAETGTDARIPDLVLTWESWRARAPGTDADHDASAGFWEHLFRRLSTSAPPADLTPDVPGPEQNYQVLVRSCAALPRYAILVAAHRQLERGVSSGIVREKLPAAESEQPEPWMKEVARTDLRGLFLHAPAALRFLTRSPNVIPAKIPDELDAAGLLQRYNGKPWLIHYGREAIRPYGPDGLNTMVKSK